MENWRLKVFCPAFLQKSGRGPGAEPWPRAAARGIPPCSQSAGGGQRGNPRRGFPLCGRPPPPAASRTSITPVVNERRAGVEPRPYEGLAEHGEVGDGRRKGSSRTPTPTAGGKRAVRRIICRESIPRPGEGRRNVVRPACTVTAGRRGRRPLQGWCDAVGSALTVTAGRLRDGPRNWVEALRPGPSSNTHQSRSRHSWRSPPGCRQRLRCRRRLRPRDRGLLCGPRP